MGEDRRRKGLPIATTTIKPTTTTTGNPTLTKPAFIRIQEKLLDASSTTTATTTTQEPTTSTTTTNLVNSGNVVVNHWACELDNMKTENCQHSDKNCIDLYLYLLLNFVALD